MNRREFLTNATLGAATLSFAKLDFPMMSNAHAASPAFELPKLPYAQNALAPYISANTLSFHYGKHHAGYFTKLNELVKGTPFADQTLEKIIQTAGDKPAIFNNAAQAWNHTFYWKSLRPKAGGVPKGSVKGAIDASFGIYDQFRAELIEKSTSLFGSGWTWLIHEDGKIKIIQTKDADTPIAHGQTPLLALDVWEHAYYLDYQNKRKDYVTAVVDHLLNWDLVAENLPKA